MKRTFDQQRLPNGSVSASAQPQSISAPATPRPETPQGLEAAYANYGYGPRHPSHELNRQAEAQAAAARNAEFYAAQAQAAAQQQAIAAQQAAQAYQQSQMRNASGMAPLYPSYNPAYQHFPSQAPQQQPPIGQLTPPSKRPRFDSNNGASLPAPPASLPPMPQQPSAVRPIVDPSRGPPHQQGRRNVFPPPYSGPTGPPGPPFIPAQPFPPMQGFGPGPHSPPFHQGAFPSATGPMRGGPPTRGHMMNDRGGRGRGGPPLPPQRMTPIGRGQPQRGRARDRGRVRQTRGRQGQPDEKRRAFSDFRITSIEINELDWSWQGEPFTREPSTAVASLEESQARGKHKREEDSEDEREAAKKVRADSAGREEGPSAAPSTSTAGRSPEGSEQSGITTPLTPAEASASKLPDEPTSKEDLSSPEVAVAASRADDENTDDLDGVPADGSEHSRGISPSPSVASTVGKAKRGGSGPGREGNRLRIYFGAPVEAAKQPRRPPIPIRPPVPEQPDDDEPAEESETAQSLSDLLPDLAAAAQAASSEAGPSIKPIEAPNNDINVPSEKPDASPDRISISYAKNTRRMIIDAAIIEVLRLHRSEHRIELVLNIVKSADGDEDEASIFKGFMIEALDVHADDFVSVDRQAIRNADGRNRKRARSESVPADAKDEEDLQDELLPPVHRLRIAGSDGTQESDESPNLGLTRLSFAIVLDKANPLGEPKWARTGQVDEWIAQTASRKKDEGGWRGKIQVMDPEPPPTFQHALDTWVESSQLEISREELRKFASTHMQQPENVIEVLLRVIRGDARQERPSHTLPSTQPPAVAKMARELKVPYASHQTHVSLATYQLYRMAIEQSGPAGSPSRKAADKRVGEIVRALPYHLVFRVLDSMAKESLRL